MPQKEELMKIGGKVNIDLEKVSDRIPEKLLEKLNTNTSGIIFDYKITDGGGIGFIVELVDGSMSWFFKEELKNYSSPSKDDIERSQQTKGGTSIVRSKLSTYSSQKNFLVKGKMSIESDYKVSYMLNPINFINWLIYSTKDVL